MIDLIVLGAVVMCGCRMCARQRAILRAAVHMVIAFMFGLGVGMFARDDADSRVYLIAAVGMVLMEAVGYLIAVICPKIGCGSFLAGLMARPHKVSSVSGATKEG